MDEIGGTIKRLVYSAILSGQQWKAAADCICMAQSKTTAIETSVVLIIAKYNWKLFFNHLNLYQKRRKHIQSKY